jgi:hypothetical protein
VWQKQGGELERFLYYSSGRWWGSNRKSMEIGRSGGSLTLISAALTPDQARPSEVWKLYDGTQFVANPEVQVRRQQ